MQISNVFFCCQHEQTKSKTSTISYNSLVALKTYSYNLELPVARALLAPTFVINKKNSMRYLKNYRFMWTISL